MSESEIIQVLKENIGEKSRGDKRLIHLATLKKKSHLRNTIKSKDWKKTFTAHIIDKVLIFLLYKERNIEGTKNLIEKLRKDNSLSHTHSH